MKKIIVLILMLCATLTLALTKPAASADDGVTMSQYAIKLKDLIVNQNLHGGIVLNKSVAKTMKNGDMNDNLWVDNTYQYVTIPALRNNAIDVITWSVGTDKWKTEKVRNIALDFEQKNPGWMVVAAVNGDFFDINKTDQPISAYVQNGDVYKPVGSKETIGFTDDGGYIYGKPTADEDMSLIVLEGNDVVSKTKIDALNQLPNVGGLALFTTDFSGQVNLSGYTVYIGSYLVNRVSGENRFVRGSITGIDTDKTSLTKVPTGQFYLVTKDVSYESLLAIGTTVKCEKELTGAFAGIKNVVGTRYRLIDNGVVQHQGRQTSQDYLVTTAHARTAIGFKQDGSIILLVIDGGIPAEQKNGATLFETGELLRLAGAIDGFNLDGGGSSTMVLRNTEGELEVINTPSDRHERSVSNALLFVTRDPKLKVSAVGSDYMEFEQTGAIVDGSIKDISVRVGGKTYAFEGNKAKATGLNKNSTYSVTFYYTIVENDGRERRCASAEYKIKTAGDVEIKKFELNKKLNLGVELSYRYSDDKDLVEEAYIEYGDKKETLTGKSGTVEITGLTKGETYEFKLVLKLNNGETIRSGILSVVAEGKISGGGGGGCSMGAVQYFLVLLSVLPLGLIFFKRRK